MKIITCLFLLSAFSISATTPEPLRDNPPNAASQGSSPAAGTSDAPIGPTEEQEERVNNSSMGGAPNAGGGMGTGTGAGSRVGNEIDQGTINAGAVSGEENE